MQELQDDDDWKSAEVKWIAIARKYGWELVNCTDGGDGVTNLSGESKERMLKTWKGRKHKPESIEKMRQRSSGVVATEKSRDKRSLIFKGRQILWTDKLQLANRKFTDQDILDVQIAISNGEKVIDLANKYSVHRTTISKIKAGTYKTFKQKTINYKKPRRYHLLMQL